MRLYSFGTYTFDNVKLQDLGLEVTARPAVARVAGADGGYMVRQGDLPLDPVTLTQTLRIVGDTATEAQSLYDSLVQALRSGRQLLKVVLPDGTYRQQYAQLAQANLGRPARLGQKVIEVRFALYLSYPWWEDDDQTTVEQTGIGTSPYQFAVNNAGTLPNKGVRVEVEGACQNPQVENVTTGESWSYSGTLEAGDLLVVDGQQGTVTLNGGDAYANLTLGDTQVAFLTLAQGQNTLRFSATSPSNVTVRVKFRPWYW